MSMGGNDDGEAGCEDDKEQSVWLYGYNHLQPTNWASY